MVDHRLKAAQIRLRDFNQLIIGLVSLPQMKKKSDSYKNSALYDDDNQGFTKSIVCFVTNRPFKFTNNVYDRGMDNS